MMKFHFLNVGHGDCTFVELPSGRLMMVDINNSKSLRDDDIEALARKHNMQPYDFRRIGSYRFNESWEDYYKSLLIDPFDYYQNNFPNTPIFRYVQTHPDMDHMSGLHRFFWEGEVPLYNFWDIDHQKAKEEQDFEGSRHSYLDWLVYLVLRSGMGPKKDTLGNNEKLKVIKNKRHHTGNYWTDDAIEVLSPTTTLLNTSNEKESWNNASYVLRFNHGGRSVMLTGDAGQEAWDSMIGGINSAQLNCDVLKAAHHGRLNGYHEDAVGMMNPSVVVSSVGKKPASDAHDEYRSHGAEVFSTRSRGTLTATLWDDGEIWVQDVSGTKLAFLPALT